MIIKWLGHASFLITLEDGIKIITDPYETGFHESFTYSPIKEIADIVTISHEHGDHNAVDKLPGNPEVVRGVGTHQVRGIQFTGIDSYHDKSGGAERGPNTIFDRLFVMRITASANSRIVNSPGFPKFTGPIKSSGPAIIRTSPSIKSLT